MHRFFLTLLALLAGLALFVYAVREAGAAEIAGGVARVGWGLLPVLLLGGLRFVLRALSWRLCMPATVRMPFARVFSAFLAGDAVGNVTPLGPVVSEPAKVFLTRHRLATGEAIASLAIDNTIYAVSVAAMIVIGAVVLLATVPLPVVWREMAVVALVALVLGGLLGLRLLRGFWSGSGLRPAWRQRLAGLRETVRCFTSGHPVRLVRILTLHSGFHALTVVETFIVLDWLLGGSATLAQAFILATLNRVVQVAFKFVPFLVGVDEASSGALAQLLNVDVGAAVTLAVVRKIRVLFWTGAGLLLTAWYPAQAVPATDRRGSGPAHRT